MALVTGLTQRFPIPHEPNEWMELRRLSWRQQEEAAAVVSDAALERMKKMGGDMVATLQKAAAGQAPDPSANYDKATVLQKGIAQWSYDAKVTPATIDDLDEATADWAFKAILSLHAPRTEEQQKNGSPPSTSR